MTDAARGQRALVVGASGFIGRWVSRELTVRGASVVGVVRDPQASGDALGSWSRPPDLVAADLSHPGEARTVIERVQPDLVFNLAGYGVDRTEHDEALSARLNHGLVVELAAACASARRSTPLRLLHVGSALEYGIAGGLLSEDTTPQPTTLYGRTKLAGTQALTSAATEAGTYGVTARLFTVFGSGEHAGRLFPALVEAARTGATVPLTDGTQRRDFAWAGDVASLLVDLALSSYRAGEIVNVASGQMHAVAVFVRECAAQLGIPSQKLQFGALAARPEEMHHAGVDVRRLQGLVGRTANTDLRAAIQLALSTSPSRTD